MMTDIMHAHVKGPDLADPTGAKEEQLYMCRSGADVPPRPMRAAATAEACRRRGVGPRSCACACFAAVLSMYVRPAYVLCVSGVPRSQAPAAPEARRGYTPPPPRVGVRFLLGSGDLVVSILRHPH